MAEVPERLRARIEDRTAVVGVAGLGYVGLPLAPEFAKAGFRAVGIDPGEGRIDRVNRGESSIGDVRSKELAADCVVIHTDHTGFDYDWVVEHARLVFDTRNATREVKAGRDKVIRL